MSTSGPQSLKSMELPPAASAVAPPLLRAGRAAGWRRASAWHPELEASSKQSYMEKHFQGLVVQGFVSNDSWNGYNAKKIEGGWGQVVRL